jgi:hypothetical protein
MKANEANRNSNENNIANEMKIINRKWQCGENVSMCHNGMKMAAMKYQLKIISIMYQ